MQISDFVWNNRKALLFIVFLLCLLGGYFAVHLPVAIFPQLVVPRVVLAADAGDIPIETTLVQVTRPLEAAVSTVPGVARVFSTTTRGSAGVEVTFADGSDMTLALQRVQSQIADARAASLPPSTNVTAAVLNPSLFPILGLSLTADPAKGGAVQNGVSLRRLALYTLRPRLARLEGIAQVRVAGGDTPEYLVSVRPDALAARGLTLQEVQDALAKANSIASVGQYERSYQRYEVLVSGLLRSADDIRQVAIAVKNGVSIRVSDVAVVRESVARPTILVTGDGRPGVTLNIVKQPEANTLLVAQEVEQVFKEVLPTLPPGVRASTFYDQSVIVAQSESSVVEAIVVGGVLALLVLILFLGNLRVAIIILIQLPIALIITFSLMRVLGQTLNIMTLGALAIAMGMVIDDAIVVVENMYHELERGLSRPEAVSAGMRAITPALIGSSLTTMVTFLPLTFLSGVTGQFFAPLALVMIATLAVSLLLALLLTPLLARYILPPRVDHHRDGNQPQSFLRRLAGFFPRVFDIVAAGFARLLSVCLRHRWIVVALSLGALGGTAFLYPRLATGFFPEFDEGAFVIDYLMPPGTSLQETDRVCREVEAVLAKTPDVASWSRLSGARSGSGLELSEQSQGDILVRLKANRSGSADEVMSEVRSKIEGGFPAFQVDLIQILQDGIGDIAGSPSPIEVKLYGPDTATLTQLAHRAGAIVTATPGVVDENDGVVASGPELVVNVDSERASRAGLSADTITAAATSALRGTVATTVQQGEALLDIRVQADPATYSGDLTQTLPELPVGTSGNSPVPLRSVAHLDLVPGTPQITRENQQQMVAVTARLEGRDLGSGVKDVQARLAKNLSLPPGYRLEYGGLYASQQKSFAELSSVLLVAFLLVATMLLIQLRSFKQSFALLAAAILALSGVVIALLLTHTPLNLSSFTGAIMVVGIVTEDGIVFFDVVNHQRRLRPQTPLAETVMEARRMRMRPILMTIIAAILALYPLALGIGAGAAMQRPLAIAVVGGLIASTLFTLLVAPTLYVAFEGRAGTLPK